MAYTPDTGLPVQQANAHLGDDLAMRVGVPHRGGKLAFHAFNHGYPVMVSCNAFWDSSAGTFKMPEATDLSECDFALDSAGFTAMSLWKRKGAQAGMAGIFPWTCSQYLEFACCSGASWYSQPDLCCEPEIAQNAAEVDYRIRATATLLEAVLRQLYAWQNELARTLPTRVVANMLPPPVPVIQGWSGDDYRRSLDLLVQVWQRWQPWLASPALIGVGSVCRRTLNHPTHGLYSVLAGLEGNLPAGARLHLFGVKGAALQQLRTYPWIASADSMAYDFSARQKALREGRSNTLAHRSGEMTRWMSAAVERMRPTAGDQHRLAF